MNLLTICYSTHRPETLGFSARIMQEHDLILLEEPPHPDFQRMLNGEIDLDEHMLELDAGYPVFARRQYKLLQVMKKAGKEIVQTEPFLEKLLQIHLFFADGSSPDEIDKESEAYEVYCREKDATGTLIDYYQTVRSTDYSAILKSMQAFARADAARFRLRDMLRAEQIIELLETGRKIYIEAGSIHLALHKYLGEKLPRDWSLRVHFIEREAMQRIGLKGSIFNPGDELTLSYIFGKTMSCEREQLLCAQSLIYAKLVRKDEVRPEDTSFPHTRNDVKAISIARALSLEACHELFYRIRVLTTEEAEVHVIKYMDRAGLSVR
jgi:hypothetical protein